MSGAQENLFQRPQFLAKKNGNVQPRGIKKGDTPGVDVWVAAGEDPYDAVRAAAMLANTVPEPYQIIRAVGPLSVPFFVYGAVLAAREQQGKKVPFEHDVPVIMYAAYDEYLEQFDPTAGHGIATSKILSAGGYSVEVAYDGSNDVSVHFPPRDRSQKG